MFGRNECKALRKTQIVGARCLDVEYELFKNVMVVLMTPAPLSRSTAKKDAGAYCHVLSTMGFGKRGVGNDCEGVCYCKSRSSSS